VTFLFEDIKYTIGENYLLSQSFLLPLRWFDLVENVLYSYQKASLFKIGLDQTLTN